MITLKSKVTKAPAGRRDDRVPVPCCTCGKPTSLRVERALLEEIEVFHLCPACFRNVPADPPTRGA